jgi:hypothetical protein
MRIKTAPMWGTPRPPTSWGEVYSPERALFWGAKSNLCLLALIASYDLATQLISAIKSTCKNGSGA